MLALIPTSAVRAAEVRVMISAGFFHVYSELAPAFERGLVRADSKVVLARSQIGMVVQAGAAKPDIATVDAFKKTLLEAKSIAYSDSGSGTYLSKTLFPKLGVADQIAQKSRKVRGPPSGEPVAAVVARGEAEIGFQQVSEVMNVPGTTYVGTIPAELQPGFTFAGAVTSRAAQPEAARALLEYLSSSEAAPIVTKAGLAPPRRAGHGTRFPTRRLLSLDPRWCAKFHCNDPCLAVYRETCVSGGRPPCD